MSITGAWKNEYGSTMILTTIGNIIAGTYKSSTDRLVNIEFQVVRQADATAALGSADCTSNRLAFCGRWSVRP